MKAAIYTLGCKVNQFESQALEQELKLRGFTIVPFTEPADVYLVNSCTVTATSDQKSRQTLSRARRAHPGAVVVLCGCYAQVAPETEQLDADLIMGTGDRKGLVDRIEELLQDRRRRVLRDDVWTHRSFELLPAGSVQGRTRALMKVQDGCSNFCSYCIIPYARGPVRSMPLETAREEAARLQREGYRELVVTGIEISSYGRDLPEKPALETLLTAICQAAPEVRVRLGSLEPRTVTEDFCRTLAAEKNLCPHFHLSLQSGCDATLARMNRKYTTARYRESVELLRRYFPGCAITTDLIAGFPGETEEEWAETMAFLKEARLSEMHIFPYSRRKGTPAAKMPGQLTRAEKHERTAEAAALAETMKQEYRGALVGKQLAVLFEQEEKGFCIGHAPNYVPVRVSGTALRGQVRMVRIIALEEGGLLGELAE